LSLIAGEGHLFGWVANAGDLVAAAADEKHATGAA